MTTYIKPLREAIDALINAAETGITPEMDTRFHAEADAAEQKLLNNLLELLDFTSAERFIRVQVQLLVELDDRLYQAMGELSDPYVEVLRGMAKRLVLAVPGVDSATLPLPEGVWAGLRGVWSTRLSTAQEHLREQGVEEELIALVGLVGGTRAPDEASGTSQQSFTLGRYRYLNRLLGELEAFRFIKPTRKPLKGESPTIQLEHLLIQSGYNHLRFFNYYATGIVRQLKASHTREGRLTVLDKAAMTLRSLKPLGTDRYEADFEPIDGALLGWIAEERERVVEDKELIESEAAYHRVQLGTSVPEEAVMAKLFYDEQLIVEPSVDVVAGKMAYNFSSKGRELVSETSIRSKMDSRDPMVLFTVKRWLENMVKRIDGLLN